LPVFSRNGKHGLKSVTDPNPSAEPGSVAVNISDTNQLRDLIDNGVQDPVGSNRQRGARPGRKSARDRAGAAADDGGNGRQRVQPLRDRDNRPRNFPGR
jgi:hypothetical protein